ncbi:RNA polymerase sigma factor [Oceanicoccus sagamiensis]|uniref:RNA polymerase sigma factor n=1 Tax=Oceanicoccus sagamiensis TaxID=716816 RepID=A0A1X9NIL1_9GAMM|nr:RNA polymerase sigma factor [Oceanicoccus sagamiensis]ARN73823.1 hypothetical protein BST96_06665 [Oceanicoccus sagamiensis]
MSKPPGTAQRKKRNARLLDVFLACEIPLKRFLYRFSNRPEDIDDLAQEAFLRAFRAESSEPIKSPRAYLFRVARNIALRELGKNSRQLTDYLEEAVDDSILGGGASVEEDLIAQQKLQLCCAAVAELPEQCRRVFLLRKVHALSHKEIARELDISVKTVEKHIAKGVDRYTDYINNQELADRQQAPDHRDSQPAHSTSTQHPGNHND